MNEGEGQGSQFFGKDEDEEGEYAQGTGVRLPKKVEI